jgi:ABC-2 type transport system permease protein
MDKLRQIWESGIWTVVVKDMATLLRDRQNLLVFVWPPLLYIMIYGFALNPNVQQVSLGVMDYARTASSRELVATLAASQVVTPRVHVLRDEDLVRSLLSGQVEVAITIPPEFDRQLVQHAQAEVQILIDGVDANRAGILQGYLGQIIRQFRYPHDFLAAPPILQTQTVMLYNPGLVSSWYFVPGVIGVIFTGICTFAGAAAMTAEKDHGTFEQLILTPLAPWEVLLGKLLPIFAIVLAMVLLSTSFAQIMFGLPFRGSLLWFVVGTSAYMTMAISLGLLLGLLTQNLLQAFLTSFFINLPLVQLSGAYTPIEAMPPLVQHLSALNPLRHYIALVRSILLKGSGVELLWQPLFGLMILAVGMFCLGWVVLRRQTRQG